MNQDKLLLLILGALTLASLTSYMVYNHQQQQQQADSNPLSSFGFLDSQDLTLRAALFRNWMIEHEKQYSDAELTQRFVIWNKNYDIVQEHNAKNLSWELETNKFADLTDEEFVALYTGYIPDNVSVEQEQQAEISEEEEEEEEAMESSESKLQEEDIDWRSKGAVTNIKDQGQCGGCYAFAIAAAIEGLARINKSTQESFSPQQIIDCSTVNGNKGCNGGSLAATLTYAQNEGLTTEKQYPYTGVAKKCTYDKNSQKVYQPRGYKKVAKNDPDALYNALLQNPVAIGVDATNNDFKLYKSGIISSGCGVDLDHAVLLVGYQSSTLEHWIIKNSWGTKWGENGYVRIVKSNGEGICGVNKTPYFPN